MSSAASGIPASLTQAQQVKVSQGPLPGSSAGDGEASAAPGEGAEGAAESWSLRLGKLALRLRVLAMVAFHVVAFACIYPLVYLIRFDGVVPAKEHALMLATLPVVVLLKLLVFLAMGSHRGWWRYATFADMISLAEAATLGSVAVVCASQFYYFSHAGEAIPRSVIVMDWAGTMLLIGGLRGSTRLFRERYYPMIASKRPRRALLVGASRSGLAVVRELLGRPQLGLRVVGFLDEDPALLGRVVAGVPVLGKPDDVEQHVARHRIDTVLIPTPAVPPQEVRKMVRAATALGVKVQVVPEYDAILTGKMTAQPRDVDIHDLLCREPVKLDGESVGRFIRGRVVLVTGAAGSIGSEICRQALAFQPTQLILLDHSENGLFHIERELKAIAHNTDVVVRVASITDASRLRATFERFRPAVVFHAAAHKHVPMMEANPGEAVKNNVFGTRILVDEAVRSGVEAFVMISTDKAVNPTSVMGACKRLAEMYIQSLWGKVNTRLVTVRFGNVLGSNGSVVPLFKEQVRKGGPVTVTHPEMTRYFMTISEATQLVLQAGALGKGGEIFVLDMGEPVKVVDLARDLIRLSGLEEGKGIEIVYTGLRPGEKLYEELYDDQEERLPTPHPKIFLAKHRECPLDGLNSQFQRMARLTDSPADDVVAALSELVPEYTPRRPSTTKQLQTVHNGALEQPTGWSEDDSESLTGGLIGGRVAEPLARLAPADSGLRPHS